MFTKQPYQAPEAEIIPLHTEGAILAGSMNQTAIGANIAFSIDEPDFNAFF